MQHIEKLKQSGKIAGYTSHYQPKQNPERKKIRAKDKVSYEKKFIESYLNSICERKCLKLSTELKFSERKFRFDWAIESEMIAIEYEGIFSKKSRHTTVSGYSKDTEKYNLAASLGWMVYRYTSATYKNIIKDFNEMSENVRKKEI